MADHVCDWACYVDKYGGDHHSNGNGIQAMYPWRGRNSETIATSHVQPSPKSTTSGADDA